MKVYARVRSNGEYHSNNIGHAVVGFRELGAEIVKFEDTRDIYDVITKDDIVLDYIDQIHWLLSKFGIEAELEDYPEVLKPYLGRKIWKDTINHINSNPSTWGIFVKSVRQKAFTGRVINSTKDLIGCGSCYENYEVYCSEVIDIRREFRSFIKYDELLDIRPYKGDYHYNYDPLVVDAVLDSFRSWKDRPMACSIDFGVTSDNKTIVIEVNDAYALGNYGLHYLDYAKLISARWSQLLNREDEFDFRK